ncbi:MAG: translocation/assembly module TamB domain-containing protein [Methanosarcina sp.]
MIKKIIKILLMIAGSLIILLLLIVFFIGMGWLNGIILRTISKQAATNLNGELTIGSMTGRIFSGFKLQDIILTGDSDTILACREVDVQYNLKALLHKKVELNLVQIINPSLKLIQEQDSTWNFMNILRSNEETKDTAESNSEWKIVLSSFSLSQLKAAISPLMKGTIPEFIEANTRLNAIASGDTVNIRLDSLHFFTRNPDFELVNLSGRFISLAGTLSWKDVELRLKNSLARSEGSFNTKLGSTPGIELALSPFSIEDVRSFMPGISIYGSPFLSATLNGDPGEYQFNIEMTAENQKFDLNGILKNFKSNPQYSGSLAAENLDASYWTHDKAMSTKISGNVHFNGSGFDPEQNTVSLEGKFNNLRYNDYELLGFMIDASKEKDHVAGSLNADAEIGIVEMKFNIDRLFSIPVYDIFCTYRDVNASVLPGLDSIQTDLSGDLHIKGSGTAPKELRASVVLNSYDSKILGDPIDKFTLTAFYDKGSYDFDLPGLRTPYFNASATGKGNIRNNDISFHFEPLAPGRLLTMFGMPQITVAGKAEGTIKGSSDSLEAVLNLDLNNIVYDSIRIGQLTADANIAKLGESYKGDLSLAMDSIFYGSTNLRSADLKVEGSDSTIHADLKVSVDDSLNAAFTGLVAGFKNPLINIEKLSVEYGSMEWSSINDSASIQMNPEFIRVNGFGMESGGQAIKVNGRFAFRGDEDISLNAEKLDLALLPVEKFLPVSASGIISSYFHLGGTSANPLITGNLSADDLHIGEIVIDSIRSVIQYSDDIFGYHGRISQELNDSISVIARIPVHISFSDSIYLKRDNDSFHLKAGFDSLDLKTAASLFPLPRIELSGIAGFSADIKNTINDPVIGGRMHIRNGHLLYPDFGVDYKNIVINAEIDDNRMSVDTFAMRAGKGNLSLHGTAGIQGRDSMQLSDIDFALRADNFQALKSGKAELNFNSDARVSGATDKSLFSGNFRINSSKINADYLTSEFSKKKDDPNPPLLVVAMQDTNSIVMSSDTSSTKGFSYSELFKDTEGEITIDIPGNTWITGEDMNFELDGTMRVVMEKSIMNLFGDLNVKRGYYKIYGRSFNFSKGKITFTGGSEINPEVDFEIVYRFRDIDKDLRDLKLAITGRMLQPKLAFFLDDEVLEEKDALSYIAFGKSVNQLGEGEREKMSGQSIAMGAAVTQLSSALKGVLQESAGIDVFEVTEGEDWKSGNVTIGKYVTNKLFLGYERSFDFNRETKTANTEKVMLEYQILRNLILKATNQAINSGFDLIFRKSWR